MGRPLNQFLIEFLSAPSGETQTTVEFALKNGQFRRFATDTLTIDGNLYTDHLIMAEDIDESEDISTDRTEITIQNVDKAIGLDIKNGLIHFAQVSLGRIFRKSDGTTEWRELFFGEAIPLPYNEREAKIEIVDDMVAASYCVANWTLSSVCQLIFKSSECGHAGAETSCNKLLKGDCTKYGRTHRNVSETFPLIKNPPAPTELPIYNGGGIILEDEPLSRWKGGFSGYYDYQNSLNY